MMDALDRDYLELIARVNAIATLLMANGVFTESEYTDEVGKALGEILEWQRNQQTIAPG